MARVYAKCVELRLPGREEKRAIEHRIWSEHGWNGVEPVARVEFQCRGEFLDEIGLRDPQALTNQLDAVFQRCVRWLRLIEPGTNARRVRCRLDSRWRVVAGTVFAHESSPIMRSRKHRGGARPSHVSGAVRSALAALGLLHSPDLVTPVGEVFDDETAFSEALQPEEAETWVQQSLDVVFSRASTLCASDTLARHGPRGAVRALASRTNAARARFSTIDEREAGEPSSTTAPSDGPRPKSK
jgi:hypothetical protein